MPPDQKVNKSEEPTFLFMNIGRSINYPYGWVQSDDFVAPKIIYNFDDVNDALVAPLLFVNFLLR